MLMLHLSPQNVGHIYDYVKLDNAQKADYSLPSSPFWAEHFSLKRYKQLAAGRTLLHEQITDLGDLLPRDILLYLIYLREIYSNTTNLLD